MPKLRRESVPAQSYLATGALRRFKKLSNFAYCLTLYYRIEPTVSNIPYRYIYPVRICIYMISVQNRRPVCKSAASMRGKLSHSRVKLWLSQGNVAVILLKQRAGSVRLRVGIDDGLLSWKAEKFKETQVRGKNRFIKKCREKKNFLSITNPRLCKPLFKALRFANTETKIAIEKDSDIAKKISLVHIFCRKYVFMEQLIFSSIGLVPSQRVRKIS